MPDRETIARAHKDARQGKSPSTQAGEFVHEEMHHIREGKHGARSAKQAIAIGLSRARRAGIALPTPGRGKVSASSRRRIQRDYQKGQHGGAQKPSRIRSRATMRALKREGHQAALSVALSRHAHQAAMKRSPSARSASALRAARTRENM